MSVGADQEEPSSAFVYTPWFGNASGTAVKITLANTTLTSASSSSSPSTVHPPPLSALSHPGMLGTAASPTSSASLCQPAAGMQEGGHASSSPSSFTGRSSGNSVEGPRDSPSRSRMDHPNIQSPSSRGHHDRSRRTSPNPSPIKSKPSPRPFVNPERATHNNVPTEPDIITGYKPWFASGASPAPPPPSSASRNEVSQPLPPPKSYSPKDRNSVGQSSNPPPLPPHRSSYRREEHMNTSSEGGAGSHGNPQRPSFDGGDGRSRDSMGYNDTPRSSRASSYHGHDDHDDYRGNRPPPIPPAPAFGYRDHSSSSRGPPDDFDRHGPRSFAERGRTERGSGYISDYPSNHQESDRHYMDREMSRSDSMRDDRQLPSQSPGYMQRPPSSSTSPLYGGNDLGYSTQSTGGSAALFEPSTSVSRAELQQELIRQQALFEKADEDARMYSVRIARIISLLRNHEGGMNDVDRTLLGTRGARDVPIPVRKAVPVAARPSPPVPVSRHSHRSRYMDDEDDDVIEVDTVQQQEVEEEPSHCSTKAAKKPRINRIDEDEVQELDDEDDSFFPTGSRASTASSPTSSSANKKSATKASTGGKKGGKVSTDSAGTSWELQSLPKPAVLFGVKTVACGTFSRKPRSVLLPPAGAPASVSDICATTSLDGIMQFWSVSGRNSMGTVRTSDAKTGGWAEDVCWISPSVIAIAPSAEESAVKGALITHQVSLMHDIQFKKGTVSYKLSPLYKNMPHEKGISTLCPLSPAGGCHFWLSGGVDKKVVLWSVEEAFKPKASEVRNQLLHEVHTATVQALHYCSFNSLIYSGGADRRLVAWDMGSSTNILDTSRQTGKIRDLLPIPGKPDLMLVGFNEVRDQLRVWDLRMQKFVLSFANEDATSTPSRYTHPSIHDNGYLVSLGSLSASASLNIYDLRYSKLPSESPQLLRLHEGEKRVLMGAFWGEDRMVSIGTDNKFNVTEFKLSVEPLGCQSSVIPAQSSRYPTKTQTLCHDTRHTEPQGIKGPDNTSYSNTRMQPLELTVESMRVATGPPLSPAPSPPVGIPAILSDHPSDPKLSCPVDGGLSGTTHLDPSLIHEPVDLAVDTTTVSSPSTDMTTIGIESAMTRNDITTMAVPPPPPHTDTLKLRKMNRMMGAKRDNSSSSSSSSIIRPPLPSSSSAAAVAFTSLSSSLEDVSEHNAADSSYTAATRPRKPLRMILSDDEMDEDAGIVGYSVNTMSMALDPEEDENMACLTPAIPSAEDHLTKNEMNAVIQDDPQGKAMFSMDTDVKAARNDTDEQTTDDENVKPATQKELLDMQRETQRMLRATFIDLPMTGPKFGVSSFLSGQGVIRAKRSLSFRKPVIVNDDDDNRDEDAGGSEQNPSAKTPDTQSHSNQEDCVVKDLPANNEPSHNHTSTVQQNSILGDDNFSIPTMVDKFLSKEELFRHQAIEMIQMRGSIDDEVDLQVVECHPHAVTKTQTYRKRVRNAELLALADKQIRLRREREEAARLEALAEQRRAKEEKKRLRRAAAATAENTTGSNPDMTQIKTSSDQVMYESSNINATEAPQDDFMQSILEGLDDKAYHEGDESFYPSNASMVENDDSQDPSQRNQNELTDDEMNPSQSAAPYQAVLPNTGLLDHYERITSGDLSLGMELDAMSQVTTTQSPIIFEAEVVLPSIDHPVAKSLSNMAKTHPLLSPKPVRPDVPSGSQTLQIHPPKPGTIAVLFNKKATADSVDMSLSQGALPFLSGVFVSQQHLDGGDVVTPREPQFNPLSKSESVNDSQKILDEDDRSGDADVENDEDAVAEDIDDEDENTHESKDVCGSSEIQIPADNLKLPLSISRNSILGVEAGEESVLLADGIRLTNALNPEDPAKLSESLALLLAKSSGMKKKRPKVKSMFVEEEAEESEDEFMGLGGMEGDASDSDNEDEDARNSADDDVVENLDKMIDFHRKQIQEEHEAAVKTLLHDVTSGNLRKRKGRSANGFTLDSDDDLDDEELLRRLKSKHAIAYEDIDLFDNADMEAYAQNPETAAFAKCFENNILMDRDGFISEESDVDIRVSVSKFDRHAACLSKVRHSRASPHPTEEDRNEAEGNGGEGMEEEEMLDEYKATDDDDDDYGQFDADLIDDDGSEKVQKGAEDDEEEEENLIFGRRPATTVSTSSRLQMERSSRNDVTIRKRIEISANQDNVDVLAMVMRSKGGRSLAGQSRSSYGLQSALAALPLKTARTTNALAAINVGIRTQGRIFSKASLQGGAGGANSGKRKKGFVKGATLSFINGGGLMDGDPSSLSSVSVSTAKDKPKNKGGFVPKVGASASILSRKR